MAKSLVSCFFDLLDERLRLPVTDRLLIMYSFSLLQQLCTVGYGIFYMADVNNFLLVN